MVELSKQKIYCFIIGSTASGKSRLAESLCAKFSAPLLNADSVQAYKHVSIGAAKPSADDLKDIRHYLFDLVDFPDTFTAGEFFRQTDDVLNKLPDDSLFFIVGGSGFYIQSLVNGMSKGGRSHAGLQEKLALELSELGQEKLYEKLSRLDPYAAKKISPNDHYRLFRYLELVESTGMTLQQRSAVDSENQSQGGLNQKGKIIKIGLLWDREELLKRVKMRVDQMFDNGFIQEVQSLIDGGMGEWSPLQSVGYKQIGDSLNSFGSIETSKPSQIAELKTQIVTHTMQLAKKQKTWWKKDPTVLWIKGETPLNEQIHFVEQALDELQR